MVVKGRSERKRSAGGSRYWDSVVMPTFISGPGSAAHDESREAVNYKHPVHSCKALSSGLYYENPVRGLRRLCLWLDYDF